MAKWIFAEKTKAGLRQTAYMFLLGKHLRTDPATACNGMPEGDGEDQEEDIVQSKRARAGSLALVD